MTPSPVLPGALLGPPLVDPIAAAATLSFGEAVSSHRPYLLRFARRRLQDPALIEDMVQETLLAALQGGACFEHWASLRTWLTGILLRRIADHVRGRRQHAALEAEAAASAPDDGATDDDAAGATKEPVDWLDPQRRLESRQFLQALDHGLARLPPLAARVFSLRELDGLSNEEVARELGLSPNRTAVLLHRARLSLRAGLLRRWRAQPHA
ncbi:MAG: sigma-70 family RNA polymerase sigma factor [Rhizobacter sp.]|nr:sigma-70 family RNA polymerase sigma factor [Rhizobacter sp.]